MSDHRIPAPSSHGHFDLLRELEPAVARHLDRHLEAATEWFPHQYVPWSLARDFDGPLDGEPWQPGQSPLPPAVRDALVVNLLTEDNLPSYHHEIGSCFGRDSAWGTWVHRWTAEEGRHAEALRGYLHAVRGVDPIQLERSRMAHVATGYRGTQPSLAHGLAYVAVQELATREAHRNAGHACGEPHGMRLMSRIAADENLHMVFYRGLCAELAELAPDTFLAALADVICDFQMPGHTIPGFKARAARIAAAGIYDLGIHHDHVLLPLLRTLRVMERADLGPRGEHARERIGRHLEILRDKARRLAELRTRIGQREHLSTPPAPPVRLPAQSGGKEGSR
ncbi:MULTISPECIES: acyl-ACP desaturase [unclassified Streptomyces]|uniref:acyl-ACP desaturase n=1 Tax=unclassified Streptomyces TaxID=2593676 RepID=UPI002E0D3210|nr:acyl-ACP desaturase [Streptomyces sp. NBC_01296]WSW63003.1 acyl-ACP desaturase [Streptomyces sp. NBC_00998]